MAIVDRPPCVHPSSRRPSQTPNDLESQKALPETETKRDPNLVTWNGPDDPANPQHWSFPKKAFVTAIWVYGNLCTCIASSIFSSGSGQIGQQFHVGSTVVTLGISLFLLVKAPSGASWDSD
jgi:DHA1 family multidrug resistance protein-like MFS transporter